MPHTLPLRYSKAGQGQPGQDNLHSILCLDEGRNPAGGVYSIHSSFLSCLLAQHNAFIRETGSAATTKMPTAGLQACAHLYWDEGLSSGVWGDNSSTSRPAQTQGSPLGWPMLGEPSISQHLRPTKTQHKALGRTISGGQVIEQCFRPVQV